MAPGRLMVMLGAVVLFGVGLAATALADTPPTTPQPTTTTSGAASTSTTTSTTTDTGTTTTTTTAETTTATVPTTMAPPPTSTPPQGLEHGLGVPKVTPPGNQRTHSRLKHPRPGSKPLKVTPPLGPGGYVFPVVGTSAYVDTYGAFRSDVPGKWHHGDDILALLGTPVVAVADGTMNRVGWEKVGGWRLWVRDASANEFYYAHLSGYAPSDFHSNRVKVGEVVGFIGNTGDAFNGAPHLHFEIHPHQLLGLGYDGAVDPTSYLDSWRRLRSVHAPYPVHPQLPGQPLLRIEARYVFRELLAARHLIDRQPTPSERPAIELPAGLGVASVRPLLPVRVEQALPRVVASSSRVSFPLLAGLLTVAGFAGTLVLASAVLGRRWR